MNISQVKKLRKIVRIKKLATKNNKIFVCTMKKTSVHYKMVLTIIPCLFLFLCPISNIEKIFMHILVFRPFQSSSLMITSQTTSMVRRRGSYSYNTHGSIFKCSWRGRRMDSQSSTGTGLKLQRPSTSMKAQYSPSASVVFWWDASVFVPSMMLISKGSRCCMWNLVLVQLCNGVAECWSYIMLYSDVFQLWNPASLIWKWNILCA